MENNFVLRFICAVLCSILAILFLGLGSRAEAADGTHIYVVTDNGAGFESTGSPIRRSDEQEGEVSVERVYIETIHALRSLPRRTHAGTEIHFIDTAETRVQTHSPSSLYDLRPVFLERLHSRNVCGDFARLFDALRLQLQMDAPYTAHLIIVSPMVDIDDELCRNAHAAAPTLPQLPKRSYKLDTIFAAFRFQSITIVGARQEQKRPWFDAISQTTRPQFVDLQAAPEELKRIVDGF